MSGHQANGTGAHGPVPAVAPLPQRFPKVAEIVGRSGVRAFLVRADTVPTLTVQFRFRAGAAYDPPERAGEATMLASLLDEGAAGRDSAAFQQALADHAIRLNFDADRDSLSGQLKTLSENRELAFELLGDALLQPRFDAEPVGRVQGQLAADLRRRETSPGYLASRAWFEGAFPGHAYAMPTLGLPSTLAAVTAEHLRGTSRLRLARRNLSVGIAGDITEAEAAAFLDATFGRLPEEPSLPGVADIAPATGRTLVTPLDLPQSVVTFGHAGIARSDPDYYAAYVANHILGGGGFSSRLMQEVREARGLAYSVGSQLYDADRSPLWIGSVATSNDKVSQSIAIIGEEARRLAAGDIDEAELEDARTYLTGSFPLRLTNNDQVARMLMAMMSDDLGRDYLDRRNAMIEAVDLATLKRVAARLLGHPMLVSVVGAPVGVEGERLGPRSDAVEVAA